VGHPAEADVAAGTCDSDFAEARRQRASVSASNLQGREQNHYRVVGFEGNERRRLSQELRESRLECAAGLRQL
jgi:hypothetical protein